MLNHDWAQLPKAELHAHLNGCIPPTVIASLVQRHGVVLPDGFVLPQDLTITQPVRSLLEYLRPWNVFKRLPVGKECLQTMTDTALEALSRDSVQYAELRNSPYNISEINGISLDESLEWLIEAVERSAVSHGIDARLIISFSRYRFDISRARDLLAAIGRVNTRRCIVGLDLSGNELDPIDPAVAELFRYAKDRLGLRITIHAGEVGGIENVMWAIDHCGAERLGHALSAASSPAVLETLASRRICVEVCLVSNLLTGRVDNLAYHPIHRFLEAGVPFVLCSDNPAVHQKPLTTEYQYFVEATDRSDLIAGMFEQQMKHAFR